MKRIINKIIIITSVIMLILGINTLAATGQQIVDKAKEYVG